MKEKREERDRVVSIEWGETILQIRWKKKAKIYTENTIKYATYVETCLAANVSDVTT